MNEYKSSPGFASAPLNLNGDAQNKGQDNSVKWISEGIHIFLFPTQDSYADTIYGLVYLSS